MVTTIPTDEIAERIGELLSRTSDGEDVILEQDGQTRAVIMSAAAYEDVRWLRLRDAERRRLAGEELFRLRERISARNTDLSEEQADEIADRVVRDAIDSLVERGELVFERDPLSE